VPLKYEKPNLRGLGWFVQLVPPPDWWVCSGQFFGCRLPRFYHELKSVASERNDRGGSSHFSSSAGLRLESKTPTHFQAGVSVKLAGGPDGDQPNFK
jgi:hypothetical protein